VFGRVRPETDLEGEDEKSPSVGVVWQTQRLNPHSPDEGSIFSKSLYLIESGECRSKAGETALMGDIKLFRLEKAGVNELSGTTDSIERSLQTLFEQNLETLLGVRFLASEFTTTNGRIDSLGLDENGSPVILEYKRATNQNVVNQGLFYLDWLMDHRKNFEWLVMEKMGKEAADAVDWSAPRLICVAGDFNRYDEHSVNQMQRNIELFRYRRFGTDLLMLDLVATTSVRGPGLDTKSVIDRTPAQSGNKSIRTVLDELDPVLTDRFEALHAFLKALGDDVQDSTLRFYIAYKRIKNFACIEFRPKAAKILIYVKVDPKTITLEGGFTRDVAKIGHYGTGDLEITLTKPDDLERAKPLIEQSYSAS
jgi:predicted transport protein